MINGGIINFNGGAGGSGGSSSGVTNLGIIGGTDLTGAIDLSAPSGFVVLGDNGGSSPITIAVNVHALSGLWGLSPGGGAGAIDSVGVLGGADLTGDIDFSDPSGFIVWGDTGGASPVIASIDVHAMSGLWDLNQINVNKSNMAASGQILLSNDNASGQYLWSELKGSGQLLLSNVAASGQLLVPSQDCDWNGFPTKNASTISFDHSTRTFSIQPTGSEFAYYIGCTQYLSTGDTLIIGSGEGVHYIYYDGSTLTEAVNPSDTIISNTIRTKALVSVIYWGTNQASGLYIGEERHGMSMSPVTHTYLHFVNGMEYISGLGLNNITTDGNGAVDDFAVFGIDAGVVADEDIILTVTAIPSGEGLPVYYMTGSTPNWNKVDPSGFSVRTFDQTKNTRLAYNQFTGGAWQLTEVGNNRFVLCHVFATTEKDKPMIAFIGQDTYVTKPAAQDGAETEILSLITNHILLPETRAIATIIFKTSDAYANSVKGTIVSTAEGDDYIDWRNQTISRVALTTSNHNNLTNLQGGTSNEYFHLTEAQRDNVITLPASGQVLLNELAVSGQVLLSNDAASGQVLLMEINNVSISGIVADGAIDVTVPEGHIKMYCKKDFIVGKSASDNEPEDTPDDIFMYSDGRIHLYSRSGMALLPNGDFAIGDVDFGSGTPGNIRIWSNHDCAVYTDRNIVMKPGALFLVGDEAKNEGTTPTSVNLYARGELLLSPSGNLVITTDSYSRPTVNGSGIAMIDELDVKADQSSLDASGQVLLSNDAASGQVVLNELNVSGQVLLQQAGGSVSGITSEGMMVLNAAQSATISGQDVYIRAGAHVGAGSILNKCRNTFQIGDQSSAPKDNEGTPWDIIEYTRHGIYLRPNTYFVIGDGTQGQLSPVDILMYAGGAIKLFPSGSVEIGDSGFINNTPDNIDFYGEDRFKARIKNTYGNNYEYGIDISSDNVALTTVPGNRPTINTSGIALLNEVLGSGQNVVTSIGVIGDNDLKGDIDFQTKPSGFIGITRSGKEFPNTVRATDSDVVLYYYFDSAPTSGVAIPNRATAADPNTDLDWYSIPGGNYFDGAGLYGTEINDGDPDGRPLQWNDRNPYAASGNLSLVASTDIAYYDKWRNVANWEANNISTALASGDFSFGMWFKVVRQDNDIVAAAMLNFASAIGSLNYGYYLDIADTNGIMGFRKQENGPKAAVSSNTAVSGAAGVGEAYWSAWNHLAITVSRTVDGDGNYTYMYLNGLEVGSSNDSDWSTVYSAANAPRYLVLGGIARNLTYYDSSLAFRDFWIMDRVISEGEVAYIFNNDIAKESLVANDLQFNVDHQALSGLWQLDRVVQNAEDLKGSGQLLLTDIDAKADQSSLDSSGQVLLNNNAVSGQVILSNVAQSVGAQGGADLTGDIDLSDPSGFIVWGDTGGASPVTASIDVHAMSGLWELGSTGFYKEAIGVAAVAWTITHDLNTKNLIVKLWDDADFAIDADSIKIDTADQITVTFSAPIAGHISIMGILGNAGTRGGGIVDSVGPLGGANLTGDVDFTSPSGFIKLGDSGGGGPVTADVDIHAMSGLWRLEAGPPFFQGTLNEHVATNSIADAYVVVSLGANINNGFVMAPSNSGLILQQDGVYRCVMQMVSNYNVENQLFKARWVKNGLAIVGGQRRSHTGTVDTTITVEHFLPFASGDILGFEAGFTIADPGSVFIKGLSSICVYRVHNGHFVYTDLL